MYTIFGIHEGRMSFPRSNLYIAGALESEFEKGLVAVATAMLYIEDLANQFSRWEDDGGCVGPIPHIPTSPTMTQQGQ